MAIEKTFINDTTSTNNRRRGKPKFAVLPYQSYQALAKELIDFETLENFLDYVHLLKTKAENTRWLSRDEVWQELGLNE